MCKLFQPKTGLGIQEKNLRALIPVDMDLFRKQLLQCIKLLCLQMNLCLPHKNISFLIRADLFDRKRLTQLDDGLIILPYGNGAERTLENKNIGASVHGWNFNVHKKAHLLRAAQEGIVFALNYGLSIMRDMGIELTTVKAGHANMFLSPLFAEAFATVTGATVQLYNTDGSQGAARGAGIGAGIYSGPKDAFAGLEPVKTIAPNNELTEAYAEAYKNFEAVLNKQI